MTQAQNIKLDWLKGVKILLVAHYIPGPCAAYLLGVMGARIIKVEPPFGDLLRQFPPFLEGEKGEKQSAYFRALNAGFESIAINFRKPEGLEVFRQLIRECDVLIDGNRPGYLEKTLQSSLDSINPEIIYTALAAHGQHGPMRNLTGHDNNVLAQAGLFSYSNQASPGLPAVFGSQIADILAGFSSTIAILGGLFARKNQKSQGKVPAIDSSLLHSAYFLNLLHLAGTNSDQKTYTTDHEWMNGGLPNYSMYLTKDEKSVFLGPIEPHLFQLFCQKLERPDWLKMLGENKLELKKELIKKFSEHDFSWWEDKLKGLDCCFSKVNDLEEALNDQQLRALGLTQAIDDPNFGQLQLPTFPVGLGNPSQPPQVPISAPSLGEHSQKILAEFLSLSKEQIQLLYEIEAVK